MLLKHLNLTTVWLYKENRPQIYTNYLPVKMTADLWTERHRSKVSEGASDHRRRSGNSSHSSVIPPLIAHVFLCSLTAGKQTSLSPSPSPPPLLVNTTSASHLSPLTSDPQSDLITGSDRLPAAAAGGKKNEARTTSSLATFNWCHMTAATLSQWAAEAVTSTWLHYHIIKNVKLKVRFLLTSYI